MAFRRDYKRDSAIGPSLKSGGGFGVEEQSQSCSTPIPRVRCARGIFPRLKFSSRLQSCHHKQASLFPSRIMSADDQAFLDIVSLCSTPILALKEQQLIRKQLSSVPNDIWRYSNNVADYVDKHLEKVSNTLREALSSSPWIPESHRPRPPPPPPKTFESVMASSSTYMRIHDWVLKNKILATVIVIAVGGATYHIIKRKSNRKKRRAKKAGNGARLEVVVVAGSPSEAITRSISLDLERRGFIVYIVCNTIEEEVLVQNESRPDIKPLMIDIVNVSYPFLSSN